MARHAKQVGRKRRAPEERGVNYLWLLTYSDLITLLVGMFIMILTMSSVDRQAVQAVSVQIAQTDVLGRTAAGRMDIRQKLVVSMLRDPEEAQRQAERLKEMIFPEDQLPPEMAKGVLERNLQIIARDNGVALQLTDALLFEPGQTKLRPAGREVLRRLATVLQLVPAPVNVAGFADSQTSKAEGNYELSIQRALGVTEDLLQGGLPANRLSVSAYGSDKPLTTSDDPKEQAANRRVEILLKTRPDLGGY